jgi:hypothetical protein
MGDCNFNFFHSHLPHLEKYSLFFKIRIPRRLSRKGWCSHILFPNSARSTIWKLSKALREDVQEALVGPPFKIYVRTTLYYVMIISNCGMTIVVWFWLNHVAWCDECLLDLDYKINYLEIQCWVGFSLDPFCLFPTYSNPNKCFLTSLHEDNNNISSS